MDGAAPARIVFCLLLSSPVRFGSIGLSVGMVGPLLFTVRPSSTSRANSMLQVETTSRRVQLPAADEGQERLPAHERRGQRTKVPASGWRRGGNSALASLAEFKEKPLATPPTIIPPAPERKAHVENQRLAIGLSSHNYRWESMSGYR